jgi:hypothetical protein
MVKSLFPTAFDFPALLAQWYGTNSTNLSTEGMLPALLSDTSGNITGGAGYRVGTSDRVIGNSTPCPDGFLVLNTTNDNVFVAHSGIWEDGGSFPTDLLLSWLAA